jgi:Family of unknown function (DUF5681)
MLRTAAMSSFPMPGRPFQKGQSGNPGGRPKELIGIQELARSHAELAIATLVKVASKGRSESARVAAAESLLNRGFGRPPQALHHSLTTTGMAQETATLKVIEAGPDNIVPLDDAVGASRVYRRIVSAGGER